VPEVVIGVPERAVHDHEHALDVVRQRLVQGSGGAVAKRSRVRGLADPDVVLGNSRGLTLNLGLDGGEAPRLRCFQHLP
jgi:hypothetical protein